MSSSYPLVRAGALVPFLKWLRSNGRPIDWAMETTELVLPPWEDPMRLVSFPNTLRVLGRLAEQEGPDIGRRVVTLGSVADLGGFGAAMLTGRTVREGLQRAVAAMKRHSSCEQFLVIPGAGGVIVREQLMMRVDQAVRHAEQVFAASIVEALCRAGSVLGDVFERVEIVPHPALGLRQVHFGSAVIAASPTNALSVLIPDRVLDRPIGGASVRLPDPEHWEVLRGKPRFSDTARLYVETMLDTGDLSIDHFAASADISRRTLQRRLAEEGTSFSQILDDLRRERAIRELAEGNAPLGSIAMDLGYSGQPAFHSAVRRWTARSPRDMRQGSRAAAH